MAEIIKELVSGVEGMLLKKAIDFITTVFVDTRLSKRKHPRKLFQNFRQSCVLSRSEGHTSGCDWWISIRSVDNMHDWRKFWKRFRGCFVFESRISTKTVVNKKVEHGMASRTTVSQLCCRLLLKGTWEHWLNVYWHVAKKWIVEKSVELHPYISQFFTGILK